MWNKYVMLATLAGATCLLRGSIGGIMSCQDGRRIVTAMQAECEGLAAASGRRPSDDFMERTRSELTKQGSPQTASMLRDIRRGARTEADHILGDMVRRANTTGLDAPLLRAAYCHLQAYEIGRQTKDRRPGDA